MDPIGIADITGAIAEIADQTVGVLRDGVVIGTFDGIVFAGSASGAGDSMDVRDASDDTIAMYEVWLLPDAIPVVAAGDTLEASSGITLSVLKTDAGTSYPAFLIVTAAKQTTGTPVGLITLKRWNAGATAWEDVSAQAFQVVFSAADTVSTDTGSRFRSASIVLIGALDADVLRGDRFTVDGGSATVEEVTKSDRTEARGTIRW